MRRVFTFVALLVAISVSSCAYDDTFVVNSITDLQKRVAILEQLQNASDKGLLIDSITEIEEGYIIKFSDGSEITVYHGKDGENGADGNDGADGKDGENGKDGADGKDGSDANCIIADIVIGEDTITIYLSDGTSFTFNRVKEETFDVVFVNTEGLVCYPGASVEVAYTIVGGDDKTAIECWGNAGWDASIIKTNATEGKVKVASPKDSKSGKVVVLATSGNGGVVMKSLYFDEGILSNIMESYEADWQTSTIEVTLKTNLNYDVRIPAEAQSWLSVADTRATLRTDKLTFTLAENPESEPARTATVELVGECGDLLQSFEITQKSQPASTPIEFADQCVKMVCVEKFDKNGDGELSPKEAAEVTSIPEYFFGNYATAVKSFNELQYFINLKSFSEYAFYYCRSLTSVTIPDSVTTIGDGAFYDCYSLTSVTIPDNVTTIGNYAFDYCSSLANVTIGDSVTTIGDYAFRDCSSLANVTIGDSVTTIGGYVFCGCSSLTSVTIPDSVTTIQEWAFSGCTSLANVTIGDSVTTIGGYVFYGCSSLTSVTIPDSVTSIGHMAFYGCSSLASITIPDSVTTIQEWAFSGCRSLTSVYITDIAAWCNISFIGTQSCHPFTSANQRGENIGNLYLNDELVTDLTIPNSVTSIKRSTFVFCSSLTSVTIPDSVTTIGEYAFCNCSKLTSVAIGNKVTSIEKYAFWNCNSLISVTIPNNVATIEYSAFSKCRNLQKFNGKFASEDGRCLIIDGALYSFAPAELAEYTIPDSVTTIGDDAFYGCSSLTSVTIPDSVTTIGDDAFAYCDSLKGVYCKATTPPTAGNYMFNNTSSNLKIYVPTQSVEVYKSASGWSEYADDIVAYDFENDCVYVYDLAKSWLGTYTAQALQLATIGQGVTVFDEVTNFTFTVTLMENSNDQVLVDGLSILGEGNPVLGQVTTDADGNYLLSVFNQVNLGEVSSNLYKLWYAFCDIPAYGDYYFVGGDYPAITFTMTKDGAISCENYTGKLYDGSDFTVCAFDVVGVDGQGNLKGMLTGQDGSLYNTWKFGTYTNIVKTEAIPSALSVNARNLSVGEIIPASMVVAM